MASISSTGIGSGLDIESLITKLMAVERRPLDLLKEKITGQETKISAYGKLSSAIDTFRGALSGLNASTDFKVFTASSSDEAVATASPSLSAAAGQYEVNITRVAEAHKMRSDAKADKDTTALGKSGDFLRISVGDYDTSYFLVETGGKTLEEVRDAVNSAPDNKGVTASIIKGNGGYQLTLTSNSTGSGSFVMVESVPFGLDKTSVAGTTYAGQKYYADSDTTSVVDGPLTFNVNGMVDVNLVGGETLDEVVTAINDAMTLAAEDVTASVESTEDGYRLVLTSGSEIDLAYSPNTFAFATTNEDRNGGGFDETDLDAVLEVDGVAVTHKSNSISDVVDGITFNLAKAGTATITVARDTGALTERAEALVTAYNTFAEALEEMGAGELFRDQTLRSVTTQVRNLLNTAADGLGMSYLSEVGINFVLQDKERPDGTVGKVSRLEFDSTTFTSKLSASFSDVAELFSDAEQGFVARLDSLLNYFGRADGFIDTRSDGINDEIERMEKRTEDLNLRMGLIEQRYRSQFGKLDALVASLTATSDFLSQQLSALSNSKG